MSEIIFNTPQSTTSNAFFQDQIENFQTTLASLNQQVISLQEAILEKDKEITDLQMRLTQSTQEDLNEHKQDETLTIVGALINLYKLLIALPAQSK
ncbi:hypothetical protein HY383_03565 [Candidatus Daviesbacteria bacterium]|nr:hypothetical protein [Candidatus Daviesbacteria bacterium]